jgi:hypothetical protein
VMSTTRRAKAHRADVVEVDGRRVGDHGRMGEILELLSAPQHPHCLVRWEGGHVSVLYSGEGTTIRAGGDVASPFAGWAGPSTGKEPDR